MHKPLNNDNFVSFALKHYNNPTCLTVDEFKNDLNRTVYIKRHLKKYVTSGKIKERLVINQIIIFLNVFGVAHGIDMLKFKLSSNLYSPLKTCLVYLELLPETEMVSVPLDTTLMSKLVNL